MVLLLIAAGPSSGSVGDGPADSNRPIEPFFVARAHPTGYAGDAPGEPEPNNLAEIRIGYFGPTDPNHPAVILWQAARLAVEQANRAGGYRGIPFRLLPVWSDNPWGSGVSSLVRLAYDQGIWAIVGGVDGPTTHLAEQVVAKVRLPLISPACSDKTVNLANVPWMFSCLPGDHLSAAALAGAVNQKCSDQPFILAAATDHDSHLFTVELQRHLARRQRFPRHHIEFDPAAGDADALVSRIVRLQSRILVLIADAPASIQILSLLEKHEWHGSLFGGPALGQSGVAQAAGRSAEGIIFPLLYVPSGRSASFESAFRARWGIAADYRAAYGYDAVNLLVGAIRTAGLNRVRIGETLRAFSGYEGVSGAIRWDPLGGNEKAVRLGTIRNGAIIPWTRVAALDDRPVQSSPAKEARHRRRPPDR
ncbi:MAG: ABC transporter substrate-binding protein [Sedimentisphaerales bacterium]|nr:ABC transporter substrate-binding protein [Sedimentisphaerales bacterium]